MQPSLAKIVEKAFLSRHFERPETDHHLPENACCVDYPATCSSKQVHWQSIGQNTNHSTTYYGCEHTVEFDTGVAGESLQITRIHLRVGEESKIQSLLPAVRNTGWMHDREIRHGSFKAIPILDHGDVKKTYSYSASRHHCLKWHVRSYGRRHVSDG